MWILLLHWRKYKGMSLNDYSVQQMLQEGRATYNMGTIYIAPEWTAEASSTSTQKRVISYKIDRDYSALRAIFGIKEGAWTTTGEPMKNSRPGPGEHLTPLSWMIARLELPLGISFTSNLLSASGDCLVCWSRWNCARFYMVQLFLDAHLPLQIWSLAIDHLSPIFKPQEWPVQDYIYLGKL